MVFNKDTEKEKWKWRDNDGTIWDDHICYSTVCHHSKYVKYIPEEKMVKKIDVS